MFGLRRAVPSAVRADLSMAVLSMDLLCSELIGACALFEGRFWCNLQGDGIARMLVDL